MENLLELRNEIDAIDKEIVGLFQKRMKISSEVAEYKISTGKKVFDRAREEEKIRAVTELADNDFNRHGIEELFQQIMSMSREAAVPASRPERRGRPASLYRCGRDREIPGPGGLPGRGRSLQRGGDESLFPG